MCVISRINDDQCVIIQPYQNSVAVSIIQCEKYFRLNCGRILIVTDAALPNRTVGQIFITKWNFKLQNLGSKFETSNSIQFASFEFLWFVTVIVSHSNWNLANNLCSLQSEQESVFRIWVNYWVHLIVHQGHHLRIWWSSRINFWCSVVLICALAAVGSIGIETLLLRYGVNDKVACQLPIVVHDRHRQPSHGVFWMWWWLRKRVPDEWDCVIAILWARESSMCRVM